MPAYPTKKTDRLIAMAEQLLAQRFSKGEVKRILRAQHERTTGADDISTRTLESVISAARASLRAATDKTRDEHREDSYRLYDSILRSASASIRDKVRAQMAIDKLLGLQAPLRHLLDGTIEHTGTVGVDWSKLSDKELDNLERIAERAAPAAPAPAAGGAAGPAGHPGRKGPTQSP